MYKKGFKNLWDNLELGLLIAHLERLSGLLYARFFLVNFNDELGEIL